MSVVEMLETQLTRRTRFLQDFGNKIPEDMRRKESEFLHLVRVALAQRRLAIERLKENGLDKAVRSIEYLDKDNKGE